MNISSSHCSSCLIISLKSRRNGQQIFSLFLLLAQFCGRRVLKYFFSSLESEVPFVSESWTGHCFLGVSGISSSSEGYILLSNFSLGSFLWKKCIGFSPKVTPFKRSTINLISLSVPFRVISTLVLRIILIRHSKKVTFLKDLELLQKQ
jgi:hypothetical protein